MKVGFILGSGVSIPSGGPTTDNLTKRVLNGSEVYRHTDGVYCLLAKPAQPEVQRIKDLLSYLCSRAKTFFANNKTSDREPNYEDIYYLCSQLADAVNEFENPAVSEFLDEVKRQFLLKPLGPTAQFQADQLLVEARRYIRFIIANELRHLTPVGNTLSAIMDSIRDDTVSEVWILTLNHDTLVETMLSNAGIEFQNGFRSIHSALSEWDAKTRFSGSSKVRLVKMHGSVNWYSGRRPPSLASSTFMSTEQVTENTWDGVTRFPHNPEFLIGTFNKMLDYTIGIYADLFCTFRTALKRIDTLVVSGYSFGDKGINASVAEWARQGPGQRMLVVSPDASQYRDTARGAIRRLFDNPNSEPKTWNRNFDDTRWRDISRWRRNGLRT